MTIKLRLPPGFFHNGTDYQAAGRWHRGDLVRWVNSVLQPIGGWRRRYDLFSDTVMAPVWTDADEAPRGGIAITDIADNAANIYLGSNKALYHLTAGGAATNVSPIEFVPQAQHASPATGYGNLIYSLTSYGSERPSTFSRIQPVLTWGFTAWGLWPVAVARGQDVPLFIKLPENQTFTAIANSPSGGYDALVTDERFLMTFGKRADPLLIEWSDRESYDQWAPLQENEAGSYRLKSTGKLVRGVTTRNRILILGEADAFVGQYIGPPYVYGFDRVAENCGIVAANAVVATEDFAIWMGQDAFWIYDGEIKELPCEVYGYFRQDVDESQISKIAAFPIAANSEVWWLYQSAESPTNEHDSYIIYNYRMQIWYFGRLNRSFGLDQGVLRNPIMVSPAGEVYDHEQPQMQRASHAYIESGPLEADNGSRMLGFQWVYPDVEPDLSAVGMRLSVRDMPNMDERHAVDYELQSPTSTTSIMGRAITMRLEETGDIINWQIGDMRVEPVKNQGPQR